MKNKRNKKLLASVVLSMSLISSISNKAANAHYKYKDEDRGQLNGLVSSIHEFTNSKKNAGEVSENLFSTINTIYTNRKLNDPNSVLYKSMQENMHIKNGNLNIEKYKQYGPDALKAMILELDVDKFKGGHFTVWNGKTKAAINELAKEATEQINCCDAWFWALGGTKDNIKEYKEKAGKLQEVLEFKSKDANNISNKDTNVSQNLNWKKIVQINNDIDRTWGNKARNNDKNIQEKEKILNNVLKVYESDKKNYLQGFNFWCAIIIDKFVGCENNDISKETEAQIYYVYKTIIDEINEIANVIYLPYKNNLQYKDNLQYNEKYTELISKLKITGDLTLPIMLRPNDEGKSPLTDPLFLSKFFNAFVNDILDRNSRIKLLDEMIYKGYFQSQLDKYIIPKKIIDMAHEAIINFANANKDVKLANDFSNELDKVNYCQDVIQKLRDKLDVSLHFSNDNKIQ